MFTNTLYSVMMISSMLQKKKKGQGANDQSFDAQAKSSYNCHGQMHSSLCAAAQDIIIGLHAALETVQDFTGPSKAISRETMYHSARQCNNVSKHPLEIRYAVSRIVAGSIAYLCAFTASHCRREVWTAKKLNATPQENNNPNLQGVDGVFFTLH